MKSQGSNIGTDSVHTCSQLSTYKVHDPKLKQPKCEEKRMGKRFKIKKRPDEKMTLFNHKK